MNYELKDYPLWIIHLPEPIRSERMAVYERAFLDTGLAMKPKQYESEEQAHKRVCEFMNEIYPTIRYASNLSGESFGIGQAMKVRQLQWGEGAPDLEIKWAIGSYCGLALEMKAENASPFLKKEGTLRKSDHLEKQADYLEYLSKNLWFCAFATGSKEAIKIIRLYAERNLESVQHQIRSKQSWPSGNTKGLFD